MCRWCECSFDVPLCSLHSVHEICLEKLEAEEVDV
jgi:hypothetical protein